MTIWMRRIESSQENGAKIMGPDIRKVLGIQYPGTSKITTRKPKETKAVEQKALRPQ